MESNKGFFRGSFDVTQLRGIPSSPAAPASKFGAGHVELLAPHGGSKGNAHLSTPRTQGP